MLDEKDLQEIAHLMTVLIENEVTPKFTALAEGQQTLLTKMEELAPKSRVEELEEQVSMMQLAIRSIAHELEELKKAR